MKKTPHICRTCALWDVDAARDKAGRIQKYRVARCMWQQRVALPASLSIARHQLQPSFMASYYGENCPCWIERMKP